MYFYLAIISNCYWCYIFDGTRYYEISNKIRFYFMVTWGIVAGKNHHSLFASFVSKAWPLLTGSQSLM